MKTLIIMATIVIGVNPVYSFPLVDHGNSGKVVRVGEISNYEYEGDQQRARENDERNERRREEFRTDRQRILP